MMLNNKGITLVALVITIIILLILAGITLNLTIGQNGIFSKAQYAKEQYENARQREQEELNRLYSQMLVATNDNSQITINMKQLIDIIHPVGSIYISTNEINPSELFGGTWESYGQGRTLIGAGTGTDTNLTPKEFIANTEGGEYTHLLTSAEMPSHTHTRGTMNITGGAAFRYGSDNYGTIYDAWGAFSPTTGSGQHGAYTASTSVKQTLSRFDFNAATTWTGATSAEGGSQCIILYNHIS